MGRAEVQVRDPEQLWNSCTSTLRGEVGEGAWRTCFEGIRPLVATDDELVLGVPSSLVKERLEGRYLDLVTAAVSSAAGSTFAVRLDVQATGPNPAWDDDSDADAEAEAELDRFAAPSNGGLDQLPPDLPLNPKYTFEHFVVGSSNRFAVSAALSVAETPAQSYNPLFIHGDAGLGKTHILQAVGHYVARHFSQKQIRYVSTETMLNEFVDAIRTNSTLAFKRRYRRCDILLVDDVQFLEGKEQFQEEFFHTFNAVYQNGGQIVLTSDRHAKALTTLEERLRSRFVAGLVTEVQPPELETRLAILRKKAEGERIPVPDEVLEKMATHVKNNVRELEGALVRVCAYASLNGERVTIQLADKVLSDEFSMAETRPITPGVILQTTADTYGLTIDDLCGPSRTRPLVTARQICMYVFRELTDFSYPAIGREFGGRDHTTVIHAVDKITRLMGERRAIYDQVAELITAIKSGR